MDEKDYKLSPEYRKLLAKDLYQRLGTGTLVQDITHTSNRPTSVWLVDTLIEEVRLFADEPWISIDNIRPYLRPMSSMTEEEKNEDAMFFRAFSCSMYEREAVERNDWLNEHHFDYRGLIPMGLALAAPEDMYNIK